VRTRPERRVGRHEDDVASAAFHETGHECAHEAMRANQVDVELADELLGLDFVQGSGTDEPGVGDDDLRIAEVSRGLGGELRDRVRIGHVETMCNGLATLGPDHGCEFLARLHATRAQGHRKAGCSQGFGRFGTNAR